MEGVGYYDVLNVYVTTMTFGLFTLHPQFHSHRPRNQIYFIIRNKTASQCLVQLIFIWKKRPLTACADKERWQTHRGDKNLMIIWYSNARKRVNKKWFSTTTHTKQSAENVAAMRGEKEENLNEFKLIIHGVSLRVLIEISMWRDEKFMNNRKIYLLRILI